MPSRSCDWVTAAWLEARKDRPVTEIAAEIGCVKSHVYTLFERLGVRRRSQRHKYDISAEWLETRKHLSSEEIAAELGCKPRYVWTLFKEFGIARAKRLRPVSVPRRDCPCGPCATECMARARAGLPVRCEVNSGGEE